MKSQPQGRASLVLAALALMVAIAGVGAPGFADAAKRLVNADQVDGLDAVTAKASVNQRKGKLVATSPKTGRLPNNVIKKAPDAAKLGGKGPAAYLKKSSTKRRTLSFPAQSLNDNPVGSNPAPVGEGLAYASDLAGGGILSIARPLDWAGTDVTVKVLIRTRTGTGTGSAGFFVRPYSWNSGDEIGGVVGVTSNFVQVGTVDKSDILTITLPAESLAKSGWELVVQRNSSDTYPGSVILLGIALEYDARR